MSGIYVASKTKHAGTWNRLRDYGTPISCSWIDLGEPKDILDFDDLWLNCIFEVETSDVLVIYAEPGENLKGAYIELGVALSQGIPVLAVGLRDTTIGKTRYLRHFDTISEALVAAAAYCRVDKDMVF
jgi:hypothetical protein